MFLDNPSRDIRIEDGWKYTLYISTKSECDDIKLGNLKIADEIIAHGKANTMDNELAGIILPPPKFMHNKLSEKMCNSYHCFACEDLGVEQYITHIEPISSWDCLMDVMGDPDYVVIVKHITNAEQTV
jgi:hypothetical protein